MIKVSTIDEKRTLERFCASDDLPNFVRSWAKSLKTVRKGFQARQGTGVMVFDANGRLRSRGEALNDEVLFTKRSDRAKDERQLVMMEEDEEDPDTKGYAEIMSMSTRESDPDYLFFVANCRALHREISKKHCEYVMYEMTRGRFRFLLKTDAPAEVWDSYLDLKGRLDEGTLASKEDLMEAASVIFRTVNVVSKNLRLVAEAAEKHNYPGLVALGMRIETNRWAVAQILWDLVKDETFLQLRGKDTGTLASADLISRETLDEIAKTVGHDG